MTLFTDEPGEPRDLGITDFDKESVTLKWKAPLSDGGNPIKGKNEHHQINIHPQYKGSILTKNQVTFI